MTPWYQQTGKSLANEVQSIVDSLATSQQYRARLDHEARRRIEPTMGTLASDGMLQTGAYIRRTKALAESVQADIVGRERPKPQAVTSGADWRVRRKAKKRDKFVQAVLSDQCGQYSDGWEAAADVFLDACYYGTGVLGVFADIECSTIRIERVLARELYVDPWETRTDAPRNIFRRTPWDMDALLARFPGHASEIHAAPMPRDIDTQYVPGATGLSDIHRASRQVIVTEVWRADRGDDDPGLYAVTIGGATLHSERWESERLPFVFLRWTRSRESFWGISLAMEMAELEDAFNDGFERMLSSVKLRSGSRVFYTEGSLDPSDLTANDEEVHIAVAPGSQLPQTQMPPVLAPGELSFYQYIYGLTSELTGISEMLQTGTKPGGVTAASALMTLRDTGSRRQAQRVRAYERMFIDLYQRICDAAAMLAVDDPGFYVDWPGSDYISEIRWADTDLGDERYRVAIESSSMLTETPGGKLQALQGLYEAGLIDRDTFLRSSQDPDLEQIFSRTNAEYEWCESLIDRMLDYDDEADEPFPPDLAVPEGFLSNVPGALVQFGAAYFQARREGAPEANLQLLRDYIVQLQAMSAPPPPPPGAMPPEAGPTGAPPGPPGAPPMM